MRGRGRGRGRGGRGRGGRGRGGFAGRGRRVASREPKEDVDKTEIEDKELDVDKDVLSFFVGAVSTEQHFTAQEKNRDRYAAGMAVLQKNRVEIAQNARIRALAAAWARHDHFLADAFLEDKDNFGVNEILKAVSLLDAGRQVRVLEKKMKRLQFSTGKVKPQTMGKLKSDIDNLNSIKPQHGSASGAVCKHVKRWVKKFTADELEFYALHFPKEPWKKLADICHFHPTQDFPSMQWFLPFCFGGDAPEGSMVRRCRDVTDDNINELVKEFPIPFAHLKSRASKLTNDSKARIAGYEKRLDTVLWDYEDIRCEEADQVILQRVQAGEELNLPNGKLLERLLTIKIYRENKVDTFKCDYCEGDGSLFHDIETLINHQDRKHGNQPISYTDLNSPPSDDLSTRSYYYGSREPEKAKVDEKKAPFYPHLLPLGQKKIDSISLSLEAPIVVIGDASGSMEVAIRTSSIIAGLLTALTSAKLCFFNTENRYAPYLPKTIEEVLQLAVDTRAGGGTTPASSLWPFYDKKEVVKTFIMVTDEEENGQKEGYNFCQLYKKYHNEVFPAKLVFVSFLRHQHATGQMVRELEGEGFKPLMFKLDGSRPDLTKLDKLFGLLSSDTSTFTDEVGEMEAKIRMDGLLNTYKSLKLE